MSRPMLPRRGIGVVTVALIGLVLVAQSSGYDPWALALTAWLILAFVGTVLCIGMGWLDTRDDGPRGRRAGDTEGAAARMPRRTLAAPEAATIEEPPRSGWVPLLYVAALVYLLVSVIVGFRVVSVSGRGPIAAGILWTFSPLPLMAVLYRHRPDLARTEQRSARSRARLADRLARSSPRGR